MLQFDSKNVLILISCFMLNACAFKMQEVQEQMLVPPAALNRVISIVAVENFSGLYGNRLAKQIRADLMSEGCIKTSATGFFGNVLNGNIYADIQSSSHSQTQDVEREKDGEKYTEKVTTYYANKTRTLSVTYSLTTVMVKFWLKTNII